MAVKKPEKTQNVHEKTKLYETYFEVVISMQIKTKTLEKYFEVRKHTYTDLFLSLRGKDIIIFHACNDVKPHPLLSKYNFYVFRFVEKITNVKSCFFQDLHSNGTSHIYRRPGTVCQQEINVWKFFQITEKLSSIYTGHYWTKIQSLARSYRRKWNNIWHLLIQ